MKNLKWLALMTAVVLPLAPASGQSPTADTPDSAPPPAAVAPVNLSASTAEIVRLAEAGTGEDVLLSYIQSSKSLFQLSADQILYLKDIGLSSGAITAMLNRDSALQGQPQNNAYSQTAYPASAPPAPAVAPVLNSPPEPVAQAPVAQAPASVYVSSPPPEVTYFYGSLSPYGSWVQLDGVGWCWQPRVVVMNHTWRPYCDGGHWVYTDAGWFWQSDYSWGWAPFHYGRWQLHERCGWVWLPDRVWGPSWVIWRSEGDRCGWAPVPPHAEFDIRLGWRFNGVRVAVNFDFGLRPDHFTFVALKDFRDRDLGHRRLAPAEVTKIYGHTTVINNYVVNNNTIINQGIKVDRVAAATHTQIRKVAVRDAPVGANRAVRGGETSGVVYRRPLPAPAKSAPMVAQRVDEHHPVIQQAPIMTPRVTSGQGNIPRSSANVDRRTQTAPQRGVTSGTFQPASSAPSAQPTRPAAVPSANSRPFSASRTVEPPPRVATVQGAELPSAPKPETPGQLHPLRTGSQPRPNSAPNTPRSEAAPGYQPKSYRQATEAHALPPLNPRQDASPEPSVGAAKSDSKRGDR